MKEKQKSISKLAFERTTKTFNKKIKFLSLLFVILCLVLAGALFYPSTLIVTVPFLVLPSLFAFLSINTTLEDKDEPPLKIFFKLIRTYFTVEFNNGFRVVGSFLWSLLAATAASIVCSFVGTTIIEIMNPQIVTDLMAMIEENEYMLINKEMINYIYSNESILMLAQIESYVSFGTGLFFFIHLTQKNGVKYYFNVFGTIPMSSRDLNVVHSETMRTIRKQFNKDYAKAIWFLPVLMLIGYIGGTFLGASLNIDYINPSMVGVFGLLVLVLFFIPYYYDVTLKLFLKYQQDYLSAFYKLTVDTIEKLKKEEKIDSAKEKELLDFLKSEEIKNKPKSKKTTKKEKNHD